MCLPNITLDLFIWMAVMSFQPILWLAHGWRRFISFHFIFAQIWFFSLPFQPFTFDYQLFFVFLLFTFSISFTFCNFSVALCFRTVILLSYVMRHNNAIIIHIMCIFVADAVYNGTSNITAKLVECLVQPKQQQPPLCQPFVPFQTLTNHFQHTSCATILFYVDNINPSSKCTTHDLFMPWI